MHRFHRLSLATAATAACLVATACADDSSAEEWAAEVCMALAPWMSEIDDLTAQSGAALNSEATETEVQAELTDLLSGAARISETARVGVADAGVPDVADGETIAEYFEESLAGTRDVYQSAHDALEALDPEDEDFYEDVAHVMEELSEEYAQQGPSIAELNSEELNAAFESTPECR